MKDQIKKRFEMMQKKVEENIKNQQSNNKQKEPPKNKEKESITKKDTKEQKDSKNIKPNKPNLTKSAYNPIPNRPVVNNNNNNILASINLKKIGSTNNPNTNNSNNNKVQENKPELMKNRKSFQLKAIPNNINNQNNTSSNNIRGSTSGPVINKNNNTKNENLNNSKKEIDNKNKTNINTNNANNTKIANNKTPNSNSNKNSNKDVTPEQNKSKDVKTPTSKENNKEKDKNKDNNIDYNKENNKEKNKDNNKDYNKENNIDKSKDKKNKENDNEKKRANSLNNKNNILIEIIQDISKDKRKEYKSVKNKNVKIDLTNIKRNLPEKNIYDDDIDDIMKIDDLQGNTNENKTNQLKRTKTSNNRNGQKDFPVKKRHSLLDDNNCLTIKLKSKNNYTKDDFEVVTFSGKGAYGTVLQVYLVNDPNKKIYAIKKLDINSLYSVNRLYQAYLENDILNELDSPYIVKIYGAFEADGKIHLIMDFLPNGDLSYFIKANFPLKDEIIRFYSAEIVLFLEYMQKMKLIHRDLKPQNIMIDEKGHLKVIDFGTVRKLGYYYDKREMKFKEEKVFERIDSEDIKGVKNIVNPDEEDADEDDYDEDEEDEDDDEENDENDINISEKKKKRIQKVRVKRSMTFVGTAEYISPEVIGDRPAEFGTDIWAFGVMLYQMYYNSTPFKAITTYLTFRNIEKPQISFPDDKIPEPAKDLILKILVADPKKRLGGGESGTQFDMAHLKKHPFFKKIKWNNLHNTPPPGMKEYKFYECKKKSIYKKQSKENDINDVYKVFDDTSREKSQNAKVIKEGYIKKKSTWFHYEKRYIILDTTPRIILKAANEENYFREIPLSKKCKVTLVENNCFDLKAPDKTHRFKGTENDGNDWAGLIVDAINAYAKE